MSVLRDMLADQLLFWLVKLTDDTDELEAAYALMLVRRKRYEREDAAFRMAKGKK